MPAPPRPTRTPFKADPARAELLALYKETDELLAPYSCAASSECCNFANTGREPYPTAIELAEVVRAARAVNVTFEPSRKKKHLNVVPRGTAEPRPSGEAGRRYEPRLCPMLSEQGRCRIYASRPFGCRTYFCERIIGPGKAPRTEIQRISRAIADLSARFAPRDPGARPLLRALASVNEMP